MWNWTINHDIMVLGSFLGILSNLLLEFVEFFTMINVAFTWRYVNVMQASLLSYSLNYLSRIVTAFCMNKIFIKFQIFVVFYCILIVKYYYECHGGNINSML